MSTREFERRKRNYVIGTNTIFERPFHIVDLRRVADAELVGRDGLSEMNRSSESALIGSLPFLDALCISHM